MSAEPTPFIAALGASAGGLASLTKFLEALPDDPDVAFVVVLHRASHPEDHLVDVLAQHTRLPVVPIESGLQCEANRVYVAPADHTVSFADGCFRIRPFQNRHGRMIPIDDLFRSLSETHPTCAAIVFSGTGSDGTVGIKAIKSRGGLAMAESPDSAEYDSMPQSAVATGFVDVVLPARALASWLIEFRRNGGPECMPLPETPEKLQETELDALQATLEELQRRTGHDFSHYREATVLRRIGRRMQINHVESLSDYLEFLRTRPGEADALRNELLIVVTNFFRDPDAFEALRRRVVPEIFDGIRANDHVRVWVAGCATGEETYSIAILLLEHLRSAETRPTLQIFSSDLDPHALAYAREARYPLAIAADVPEELLDRYFTEDGDHYRVNKELRECVLFSDHSVLRDPPFSRMSLLSCRNLLIYFNRELQKRVLELFHYSLLPKGFLFLGSSESVSNEGGLFRVVDAKHRIFQRTERSAAALSLPRLPLTGRRTGLSEVHPEHGERRSRGPSEVAAHLRALEEHAPPSVLVAEDYSTLHFSENAGRYLRHPGGGPTNDVLKMAPEDMRLHLRTALFQAFEHGKATSSRPIPIQLDGSKRFVHILVRPVSRTRHEGRALILFVDVDVAEEVAIHGSDADHPLVLELEEEIHQTKERLRTTVEEFETSREEMHATNEELRSVNEEYKSTMEELETGKEELHSVNEELQTLNQELKSKVDELSKARDDLQNLIDASDVGTLFLDRELRIRLFTPLVRNIFNILPADRGRPIGHITQKIHYPELERDARQVLKDLTPVEREVPGRSDDWFLVRGRPYRTVDDVIQGVVLTFVNITRRKASEDELLRSEQALQRANETLEAQVRDRTRQARELATQLILAEQHERRRIAALLHDHVQQLLFGARMQLRLFEEEELTPTGRETLETLARALSEAVELCRILTTDLSPPVLEGEHLGTMLEWLVGHMSHLYGLDVAFDYEPNDPVLDENVRTLVYHVARELLFNVVKHAGTEQASLHVGKAEDSDLVVRVADEGAGFDAETMNDLTPVPRFGLASIRERIEVLGGRFDLESAPGQGTSVMIRLPTSWDEEC